MITPSVIAQAIAFLRSGGGKLLPQDINTIGKFAQFVEQGRSKGNLGQTGQYIQSLSDNLFGKQYGYMTNPILKRAFDLVVQGAQK